jgi:hypothetical protein
MKAIRIAGLAFALVATAAGAAAVPSIAQGTGAGASNPPMPRGAIILTPRARPAPRINGARVLGIRIGASLRWNIPASGDRPMRFAAVGLPPGVTLDPATGEIAGTVAEPGDYRVQLRASNAAGRDEQPLRLVVGDAVALTPPMTWHRPENPAQPRAASTGGASDWAASGLAEHGWTRLPSADATVAPAEPSDSWMGMGVIGFVRSRREPPGSPGHWRELGMLDLGWIGPDSALHPSRLSPDEQMTQLSLWCLLAAPLRLGCDLNRLDPFTLSLLTNDEVLALDQDALGRAAALIAQNDTVQTWARPLADGSIAVGFFNLGADPGAGAIAWSDLELTGPQLVRDLWRQRNLGLYAERFDAPVTPHGVFLFRIRPATAPGLPAR